LFCTLIPTHSSRFGELTNKRIRRESRESVKQLREAIKSYRENWNRSGRVFKRRKAADKILASIAKAKKTCNAV
jgi:hypothetical protein